MRFLKPRHVNLVEHLNARIWKPWMEGVECHPYSPLSKHSLLYKMRYTQWNSLGAFFIRYSRWPAGAWCKNLGAERSSIQTSWWEEIEHSQRLWGILTHGSETRAGRPVRGGAWGRGGPPTRTWAVWYPFDTSKAAATVAFFIYTEGSGPRSARGSVSHVGYIRCNTPSHRDAHNLSEIFSFMRFGPQQKTPAASIPISCSCGRLRVSRKSIGVARAIAAFPAPFCEFSRKIIPRWQ